MNKLRFPVVVVEGNIAVGKTTFVNEAVKYLGANAMLFREPVDSEINATPFLLDFYRDMERWAYTQQVDFLTRRFNIQLEAQFHARKAAAHCAQKLEGTTGVVRRIAPEGQDHRLR